MPYHGMVLIYSTRNFIGEVENNQQNWQVGRTFCCFSKGLLQSENMNLFTSVVRKALLYLKLCKAIRTIWCLKTQGLLTEWQEIGNEDKFNFKEQVSDLKQNLLKNKNRICIVLTMMQNKTLWYFRKVIDFNTVLGKNSYL